MTPLGTEPGTRLRAKGPRAVRQTVALRKAAGGDSRWGARRFRLHGPPSLALEPNVAPSLGLGTSCQDVARPSCQVASTKTCRRREAWQPSLGQRCSMPSHRSRRSRWRSRDGRSPEGGFGERGPRATSFRLGTTRRLLAAAIQSSPSRRLRRGADRPARTQKQATTSGGQQLSPEGIRRQGTRAKRSGT
jgi:hypothetical protein